MNIRRCNQTNDVKHSRVLYHFRNHIDAKGTYISILVGRPNNTSECRQGLPPETNQTYDTLSTYERFTIEHCRWRATSIQT